MWGFSGTTTYLICDDPELLETLKKAAPSTRQLK